MHDEVLVTPDVAADVDRRPDGGRLLVAHNGSGAWSTDRGACFAGSALRVCILEHSPNPHGRLMIGGIAICIQAIGRANTGVRRSARRNRVSTSSGSYVIREVVADRIPVRDDETIGGKLLFERYPMLPFDDTLGHSNWFGADGSCDEVDFHCRAPVGIFATFSPAS